MKKFLNSNEMQWRLARTIFQGIIGVIIAYLDTLIGIAPIDPILKPIVVALVMAILSPIMSVLGSQDPGEEAE